MSVQVIVVALVIGSTFWMLGNTPVQTLRWRQWSWLLHSCVCGFSTASFVHKH